MVPDANTLVSRYLLQEYWRNLRDPFTAVMQSRDLHTEITVRNHRRQGASRWGSGGGVGRRAFQSRRVFQRCRFNRRVAAFNQAREAPKEAFSEELGECRGQGGWGGDGAPHTLIMEARKGVVLLSHLFLLPWVGLKHLKAYLSYMVQSSVIKGQLHRQFGPYLNRQ